jgi:Holliday junction DNA helicase RuvA
MGIDPGTADTGYGVVQSAGSRLRALAQGVIQTRPGAPLERRLADIHTAVAELLDDHGPDALAIEELYFGTNARTAFAVGQARGVVLLAAGQRGIPSCSYTPQQVKGAVCGRGPGSQGSGFQDGHPTARAGHPAGHRPRRGRARRGHLSPQPGSDGPGGGSGVIALISGTVAVRRTDHVVIDCGGVGYRLAVSSETLRHVPAAGNDVALHTHLVVRDDALALYGFATEEERELFLMLLGVQSVGPKVALAVLSGGSPRALMAALSAGDTGRFQAVPGIGKRTAERIVVELREKVAAETSAPAIKITRSDDPRTLARAGLLELGYSAQEAEGLLDGVEGERAEDLIAAALRTARR